MLHGGLAGLPRTFLHPPDSFHSPLGSYGHDRPRPPDRLCQPRQSSSRSRRWQKKGNGHSLSDGCHSPAHHRATSHRESFALLLRRGSRSRACLLGGQGPHGCLPALRLRRPENLHFARPAHSSLHIGCHYFDRCLLRPASRPRNHQAQCLKDEAAAVVGGGHSGLRKSLVIAQVTLSLLLLIGAGLFTRSLGNLRNLGPGFPAQNLVGFEIDPSFSGYSVPRMKVFYPQLLESLASIPGVQSTGLASVRILEDNEWDSSMTVEGFSPPTPDAHPEPFMNQVSPNYFATLGVPVVNGRDFRPTDNREVKHRPEEPADRGWEPAVAMINETFAKRYF